MGKDKMDRQRIKGLSFIVSKLKAKSIRQREVISGLQNRNKFLLEQSEDRYSKLTYREERYNKLELTLKERRLEVERLENEKDRLRAEKEDCRTEYNKSLETITKQNVELVALKGNILHKPHHTRDEEIEALHKRNRELKEKLGRENSRDNHLLIIKLKKDIDGQNLVMEELTNSNKAEIETLKKKIQIQINEIKKQDKELVEEDHTIRRLKENKKKLEEITRKFRTALEEFTGFDED